ncbi:MAG: response regulator [Anaerolineales bacterium]|nr:response regulator [Anaerolineales bacterium]
MPVTANILVVDDEPDTLGLIELTLRTAGYHVQTASGGEEALKKIREESFNLILLDVMMPGVSGYDVMERLSVEAIPYPPVIFLTAKSRPEDREAGMKRGAVGFLVKPTTRGDLLDAVAVALGRAPARHAPA